MRQLQKPGNVVLLVAAVAVTAAGIGFAATLSVNSGRLSVFRSDAVPPATSPSQSPSPSPSPSPQPCTVTFRAVATATTGGPTLTIPKPAGLVAGDVMVAQIIRDGGVYSMTPSGWTLIQSQANDLGHHLYYKVATSADVGAASFSWTVDQKAAGAIVAYSGVDGTTPLNGAVPAALIGDSNALSAPAVSPATSNGMRLAFFGLRKEGSMSTPASMTERYDFIGVTGKNAIALSGNEQLLGTSGATDLKGSTASDNGKWAGQSVALRASVSC
jgi:hypothetical protein